MSGLWGTGLVVHEVSIIAERVAPLVNEAPIGRAALIYELARRLRAELLALEAECIASTIPTGPTHELQRHQVSDHPPARCA